MSCSWGKFQVMGEYYSHLYTSTQELVDAQITVH
ncbi:N-acetylmuramidase domain-containing protein [Rahnella sp. PAMC 25559]